MMSASLRLQLDRIIDAPGVITSLTRTLNAPAWPPVQVSGHGHKLSFAAETWEPLLRVRVEEALEETFEGPWRDLARWL